MLRDLTMLLVIVTIAACRPATEAPASKPAPSDARVRGVADAFLNAWFERNPDQATYYGVPGRHHDRLPDNSREALEMWQAQEDKFLAEMKQIDPATIDSRSLGATYAITREALESSIGARLCRYELWTVSQFVNAWQVAFGYLVTIQPIGSDEARKEALARWSTLPKYIDTEISNLRDGLKHGYSAPKGNVLIVIDQMNALADGPVADSPFFSPAARDRTPEFQKAYRTLLTDQINHALRRYRDFLVKKYLPAARDTIGVSANPNGAACYDASVRYHSSLPVAAKEVHTTGLHQIDSLDQEMKMIAERSFHTSDVPALLQRLRSDPKYKFKNRQEKIAYSQAALGRAKLAIPAWFGLLPKADVVIQPYPKFREKNAPNEYNPPAEDGSRPAVFLISAYQAEKQSRVEDESIAFHETIPGHHLQGAIALERKDIHPIGRYVANSGYAEGWALYAERLADQMGLYSSDLDRIGMLSGQALRAARLVVDSGLHTMAWTRQQAIDYMLAHTAETEHDVTSEVDRYIIYPAQATSYMLGELEIRAARDEVQTTMGQRFDVKAFHDRVLEDGAVPLTFLRKKINEWARSKK